MKTVRLKKNEERRIASGHLWIFSNEIDTGVTPLSGFSSGELVRVETAQQKTVGIGYLNPQTLLCVRLLTVHPKETIDQQFFLRRFKQALMLREQFFSEPFYRFIYGESDYLPGLIIDRYDQHYVVQITTQGMEKLKDILLDALTSLLQPQSIVCRNDTNARQIEGLSTYVESAFGEPPLLLTLKENGLLFQTSILTGQKTGWFFDHRYNRSQLQWYVKDKNVLDLCSYHGGWGAHAAYYGAAHVTCVDSSRQALDFVAINAKLNHLDKRIQTQQADVFEALQVYYQANKTVDVIIVDPPAFIKKRKDVAAGLRAYERLNKLALKILNPNGILVTSSCSLHCSREMLVDVIAKASVAAGRPVKIIAQGQQDKDHPIHPAMPETAYLKTLFCSVE